jgi:hypothetical protein
MSVLLSHLENSTSNFSIGMPIWRNNGKHQMKKYVSQIIYLSWAVLSYLSIYGSTALVDLGPFFSFLIYEVYAVGRTP